MSSSKHREEEQKREAARRRQEDDRRRAEQRRRDDADRGRREADEARKKRNREDAERRKRWDEEKKEDDKRKKDDERRRRARRNRTQQETTTPARPERESKEDILLDEKIEDETRESERKKDKVIRLCPRCKKPMPRPAFNVSGWFAPKEFICDHCGYTGHFYIEVDPNEVDLQKLDEITEGKGQLEEFGIDGEEGVEDANEDFITRKQRFEKILKHYTELSLSKMAELLDFASETELEKWLLDQPGNFPFKICGNVVKIESTDMAADIDRLAASFRDWKKNEKDGLGKKE